jgi:DNA-binding response OmpR family regulator
VAGLATHPQPTQVRNVVLIIEDDEDIGNLLEELLTDEGYAVALLRSREAESVADAVERIGPDCVLLDGYVPGNYDASWADAAWMRAQEAAVPVIMFSADQRATAEAKMNLTERSQAAGFCSVLPKPFEIDDLLRVIAEAVSQSSFRRDA